MASLDVDQLRQGLADYLVALRTHLATIQDRRDDAESSFQQLMEVQEGSAADDYRSRWEPASAWLEDYFSTATRLGSLLEERLEELSQLR